MYVCVCNHRTATLLHHSLWSAHIIRSFVSITIFADDDDVVYVIIYIIVLRILYILHHPPKGIYPCYISICACTYIYILLLNEGTRLFAPRCYMYIVHIIHTYKIVYIYIMRTIKVV